MSESGVWFVSIERFDGSIQHTGHCAFGKAYATGAAMRALGQEGTRTAALCFRPDGRKSHKVVKVWDHDSYYDESGERVNRYESEEWSDESAE